MSVALTDVESVRRFLGIPLDQAGANDRLADLIQQVSAFLYEYTASTTLTTGDGANEVPKPQVRMAANAMVAHWYNRQGAAGASVAGQSDRMGAFAMPTATMQLLAPYRVIGFGHDPETE